MFEAADLKVVKAVVGVTMWHVKQIGEIKLFYLSPVWQFVETISPCIVYLDARLQVKFQ